ncbi:MAG: MerR family transcriptional regulator [Chloroflexi bacterium]|nr:MerR family transcriptional regulator [Chloroflexota bacterium]
MKISAVGKALGVPVPTLRRWTQEFGPGLTLEARGIQGQTRLFSPRDVRLLRRIGELLAEPEATYASVRRKLADERLFPATEDPSVDDQPASTPESEREAAERFVRIVCEPLMAEMLQPEQRRLLALEREVARLGAEVQSLAERLTQAAAEGAEAGRRRWPFGQPGR